MRFLVALLALTAACHSEPYGVGFHSASGPLVPGPESRLTFADTNQDGIPFHASAPTWSAGGGILYSFGPRPRGINEILGGLRCITFHPCRPVAADTGDTCLALLPPSGGSAEWNVCEFAIAAAYSNDRIDAGDVNAGGELLYTEASSPAIPQFVFPSPPQAPTHADLWLATPGDPTIRRELCRFYEDTIAQRTLPAAASCNTAGLRDIQWVGPNAFIALEGSIVQGAITSTGVTFTEVPGTGGAISYALLQSGAGAIFVTGDAAVRQATFSGAAITTRATIALHAGARTLDIGCHPDVCVVLATSGTTPGTWDLWKVDLATGASAIVRSDSTPIAAAKLSPRSGDVVALKGVNLYLIPAVVP